VTLVFTDIEGSTRLVQQLGRDRYAEALELHRRLLREAFEIHGGYEVDCEGDSFFIAFLSGRPGENPRRRSTHAGRRLEESNFTAEQLY
jgi:class 3 adenylate cyclase